MQKHSFKLYMHFFAIFQELLNEKSYANLYPKNSKQR